MNKLFRRGSQGAVSEAQNIYLIRQGERHDAASWQDLMQSSETEQSEMLSEDLSTPAKWANFCVLMDLYLDWIWHNSRKVKIVGFTILWPDHTKKDSESLIYFCRWCFPWTYLWMKHCGCSWVAIFRQELERFDRRQRTSLLPDRPDKISGIRWEGNDVYTVKVMKRVHSIV